MRGARSNVRTAGRRAALALAVALAAAGAVAPPAARGAAPSARLARTPEALELHFESVTFPAALDSAMLEGWWIPGGKGRPVVVMAGPGEGNRADLLPVARSLNGRGFGVLLFDYRDFGPRGPGAADSLKYVVLATRWIEDAVGALRFARARADSGTPVFGWGREMGSAAMLAAAGRERKLCEGLVLDNPWLNTEEAMRWNGTSTIPEAQRRQRQVLRPTDEPFTAAIRVRVPVLLTLAGREPSAPPASSDRRFASTRNKVERWLAPEATRATLPDAPGYLDKVAGWIDYIAHWARVP
jgi:pimeloyl-ACP methyl ester carboxylesterase